MKTTIEGRSVIIVALGLALSPLAQTRGFGQQADQAAPTSAEAREKNACSTNLRKIYEAIQAYRREHKELPNWLSDLVPKHLADSSVLTCPVTKRTGEDNRFKHLADPKMSCSYMYEFCDAEMGYTWGGKKLKMRNWKSLEMAVIGGNTPILRCLLHEPMLNVGFDGKFYESPLEWEEAYYDVIRREDLRPENLLARFGQALPTPLRVGHPAPKLQTGKWLQGEPVQQFETGKVYLVEFWTTESRPSRVAIPHLNALHTKYQAKGLVVIGQHCGEDDASVVEPLIKEMGDKMTYRVALDDRQGSPKGRMVKSWMDAANLDGIPTAFLVDTHGVIAWIGHPMSLTERLIEDALAGREISTEN